MTFPFRCKREKSVDRNLLRSRFHFQNFQFNLTRTVNLDCCSDRFKFIFAFHLRKQGIHDNCNRQVDNDISKFLSAVRAAGFHVDGKTEVRWLVFLAQSAKRETRGGVQHNTASRHHYGFSKWILRPSPSTGEKFDRAIYSPRYNSIFFSVSFSIFLCPALLKIANSIITRWL